MKAVERVAAERRTDGMIDLFRRAAGAAAPTALILPLDQQGAIRKARDQHIDRCRAGRLNYADRQAPRVDKCEVGKVLASLQHADVVRVTANNADIGKIVAAGLGLVDSIVVSDLERLRNISVMRYRHFWRW